MVSPTKNVHYTEFYVEPRLRSSKLGLPGIKQQRLTFVRRLICRDSVGIRTQDPQLRRLLLYPAELPNRSVLLSAFLLRFCRKWLQR